MSAVAEAFGPLDPNADQVMVPMADGVRLATDVYLPAAPGKLATVLVRLPYDKSAPFAFMPRLARHFNEDGFAFVAQDTRGRARSEGETFAFVHEVDDGASTLDWIVGQPWSDGVVGMFGDSYYGWTQWAAVASGHPALRAIVPRVTSVDVGTDWRQTGGVFDAYQMIEWAAGTWVDAPNYEALLDWSIRPLADVQAAAHAGRRSHSLDHWIATPGDDAWWMDALYAGRGDPRMSLSIPVMHTGGWWDVFRRGQVDDFHVCTARATDQHLVMASTDHFDDRLRADGDSPFVDFIENADEMERWLPEYLGRSTEFFRRYLRGEEVDPIPIVRWHLANDGWRDATTWPPAGAREMTLHLAGDGLSERPDRRPTWVRWVHDPVDPVPDLIPDAWRSLVDLPDEGQLRRRPDVQSFTGGVGTRSLDLAGPVVATITVSSTAPSTHVAAKLVDIFPDGRERRIVEGIVSVPRTGTPDATASARVDLGPTGYRVAAGHRLGLQVATSDFPRFAVHPGTDDDPMLAVRSSPSDQGVLIGGAHGSSVTVTVLD